MREIGVIMRQKGREKKTPVLMLSFCISDNQDLFGCFVLIILRKATLDTLFLYSVGEQAWLCS